MLPIVGNRAQRALLRVGQLVGSEGVKLKNRRDQE